MFEVKKPKTSEAAFLAAAFVSVAIHCVVAAMLMRFVRGETVVPAPRIIMVEIGNLLPAEKPVARPARQAAVPGKPEPVRDDRQASLPAPQPLTSADRPVTAVPPADRVTILETAPPLTIVHREHAREERPTHFAAQPKGGSTQGATVPAESARATAAYLARLRELIERQKAYPVAARRGHLQGTARIRCVLARNGELITAALQGSSGHDILDNAALRAVEGAGQFPELPAGITDAKFTFVVPITFRLESD